MHGSGLAVGQATALPTITEAVTPPPYPTPLSRFSRNLCENAQFEN